MRQALVLALLAGLAQASAFFNQWLIFVIFGAGRETDALYASMALPTLAAALTSGPLASVLVPLLAAEPEGAEDDARSMLIAATVACAAIGAVLAPLAAWWVPIFVPGFLGEDRALVIELSRIELLGIVFTAQYSVIWAYCQAKKRFVYVEASLLGATLISLGLLGWWARSGGIVGAAWAWALRPLVQAALLLPILGFSASFRPRWDGVKQAWLKMRPLMLGSIYYKSDALVDRYLSSHAPPGGLSLFYLAQSIYLAAIGVTTKVLVGPVVPGMAVLAKQKKIDELRSLVRKRFVVIVALIAGGYAVLLAAGEPLLGLLIGHGGVTPENVSTLRTIMLALGGLAIGLIGQVLASAFYAIGDTATPTKSGVVTFTIGIGLKIAGFSAFGLIGLALGTTGYYLVSLVFLTVLLEARFAKLRAQPE